MKKRMQRVDNMCLENIKMIIFSDGLTMKVEGGGLSELLILRKNTMIDLTIVTNFFFNYNFKRILFILFATIMDNTAVVFFFYLNGHILNVSLYLNVLKKKQFDKNLITSIRDGKRKNIFVYKSIIVVQSVSYVIYVL